MVVESYSIIVRTRGEEDMVDITDKVQKIVDRTKTKDGVASLFIPGSTAALTTIEYEPGLLSDFPRMLERMVPKSASYEHENRWHDGNGHSHVRASLLGPDLSVPYKERRLLLGTWQQIVLVELDIRPRDRTVIVHLVGD